MKPKTMTILIDKTKVAIDTKGRFTESDYLMCFMALAKHVIDDPDCDFSRIVEMLKRSL